jgi:ferric-dicitrate binding protein FerR (iron transport regulator)
MDNVASQEELKALDQWRASNAENEKYYQELKKVNEWYSKDTANKINVDEAWKNVNRRMHKDDSKHFNWLSVGYAGLFLLVLGAAWYLWSIQKNGVDEMQYATQENQMNYMLEDGSTILLKENSALSKLTVGERSFNFSGAATFEVEHDEVNPFIVYMDDVIVKDLGTVFDIDASPLNDTVFVKVLEGVVQFYTVENKGLLLEFGEEGMYIKSKDKFYKRSIDEDNPFLSVGFNNTTLGEVVDYLSYAFRKEIAFASDSLSQCNITVDFTKAPYSTVREIIEQTLNITIQREEETLLIKGDGCK